MMVPSVSMPKGIYPNSKGKEDHKIFKAHIINDVDPK